jgi:hypothetical protein
MPNPSKGQNLNASVRESTRSGQPHTRSVTVSSCRCQRGTRPRLGPGRAGARPRPGRARAAWALAEPGSGPFRARPGLGRSSRSGVPTPTPFGVAARGVEVASKTGCDGCHLKSLEVAEDTVANDASSFANFSGGPFRRKVGGIGGLHSAAVRPVGAVEKSRSGWLGIPDLAWPRPQNTNGRAQCKSRPPDPAQQVCFFATIE